MEELTQHLEKIKIPGPNDKVYKDECVLSFDTPVHALMIITLNIITMSSMFSLFLLTGKSQGFIC